MSTAPVHSAPRDAYDYFSEQSEESGTSGDLTLTMSPVNGYRPPTAVMGNQSSVPSKTQHEEAPSASQDHSLSQKDLEALERESRRQDESDPPFRPAFSTPSKRRADDVGSTPNSGKHVKRRTAVNISPSLNAQAGQSADLPITINGSLSAASSKALAIIKSIWGEDHTQWPTHSRCPRKILKNHSSTADTIYLQPPEEWTEYMLVKTSKLAKKVPRSAWVICQQRLEHYHHMRMKGGTNARFQGLVAADVDNVREEFEKSPPEIGEEPALVNGGDACLPQPLTSTRSSSSGENHNMLADSSVIEVQPARPSAGNRSCGIPRRRQPSRSPDIEGNRSDSDDDDDPVSYLADVMMRRVREIDLCMDAAAKHRESILIQLRFEQESHERHEMLRDQFLKLLAPIVRRRRK